MFNYSKLKGKIVEVCGSQCEFAARMGVSERTISNKMQQKKWWKQNEMVKAMNILGVDESELWDYFFCKQSSTIEH